jgi:hypothetical protein
MIQIKFLTRKFSYCNHHFRPLKNIQIRMRTRIRDTLRNSTGYVCCHLPFFSRVVEP